MLTYLLLTGLLAVVRSPTRSDRVVQSSVRADFAHRFLIAVTHEQRNKTRQSECHLWSWKLEQALSENRPGVIRAHWRDHNVHIQVSEAGFKEYHFYMPCHTPFTCGARSFRMPG